MSARREVRAIDGAARAVLRCAGVFPAATTVMLLAVPSGASAMAGWGARVSLDGGYTTEVFPGYPVATPDRFAVIAAAASKRVKPAKGVRLEWSGAVEAERFRRWEDRNAERWEAEMRARAGSFRARLRGRYAPRILLYPDPEGGARYRDREAMAGLEWRSARGLLAAVELRGEHREFDDAHPGRTQDRTRWSWLAGFEPRSGRSITIEFANQHALADDSNYDFWRNELTLAGTGAVGPLAMRLEVAQGVRNYFPESIFASNWRRQDRTQAWRVELRHPAGPLEIALRDEVLIRDSTRPDRDYRVNVIRLAMSWAIAP